MAYATRLAEKLAEKSCRVCTGGGPVQSPYSVQKREMLA